MRKLIYCVLAAIAITSGVFLINNLFQRDGRSVSAKGTKYHCPMHPTYISDRPGDCPICMMKLVPIKDDTDEGETKKAKYYCPMCPGQESDEPGHCKKCNMNLIPAPEMDPEHARVKITPERQQLIGVRMGEVQTRQLTKTIRVAGIVSPNETKTSHIHTRFSGWVEETNPQAIAGTFLEKGTRLFSIYSPEVVSAQKDYLIAITTMKKAKAMGHEKAVKDAEVLVAATRQKLEFWNISDDQIAEIEKKETPGKVVWITAPHQGYIIGDDLNPGRYIEGGQNIYMISDISTVWINAQVYEHEISSLKEGDQVTVELLAQQGKEFDGKVLFIFPNLEQTSRTVKVRIELPNDDHAVKLGMYCTVTFRLDLGERLSVPTEAVMDSGLRKIVFVKRSAGIFDPRTVKVGQRAGDYYEVLDGLSKGEEIVVSGNFLIDSESRLKASIKQMTSHDH